MTSPSRAFVFTCTVAICAIVMNLPVFAQPAVTVPSSGVVAHGVTGEEPILDGPYENWEGVFQGMPDSLSPRSRIAPPSYPGEDLRIKGQVVHLDGTPAPGIVIYAYHTDKDGIYPPDNEFKGRAAYHHGALRAWAISDEDGQYTFDTIRPGSYPGTREPQHVHLHVIEPGCCNYWITSVHFADDPFITEKERSGKWSDRGGYGLVEPERRDDGTWVVQRDIVLGLNVPQYRKHHGQ